MAVSSLKLLTVLVPTRYGFNSHGHQVVKERLQKHRPMSVEQSSCERLVGVNLGKNKTSEDEVGDYIKGVKCLGDFADYIVINVSSPNTPGLRELQGRERLARLLDKVRWWGMAAGKGETGWAPGQGEVVGRGSREGRGYGVAPEHIKV